MCYLVCGFVDLANALENAICLKGKESLDVYTNAWLQKHNQKIHKHV